MAKDSSNRMGTAHLKGCKGRTWKGGNWWPKSWISDNGDWWFRFLRRDCYEFIAQSLGVWGKSFMPFMEVLHMSGWLSSG